MDPLWMILPVFLGCTEAVTMTEVQGTLGQNATLTCPVDMKDTHWYVQIYGQISGYICRSFSQQAQTKNLNNENKYFCHGNRLEITNITAGDYRLYLCAVKQNSRITHVDSFHLVSALSHNLSEPNHQQDTHHRTIWESDHVLYGSLALNICFILALTTLVSALLHLRWKNRVIQVNEPSPVTYETPQYEEIQLSTNLPAATSDCIYYKAQLPQTMLSQL